jgi:CubicO group peptidase (beta-lactamase class C family)
MTATTVSGSCEPAFEAVRAEFARNFAEREEVGAAVCVTVDGETVVDLWGGAADPATDRAWEADTRVVVYSCTKGATALCAHVLADRGLLDLDAPVGQYWPEFATNGKEDATVSMMLDHSVGVPAVSGELPPGAMYDWDLMCDLLARQEPWWVPGTRNGYHMITFGWTVGELVRRVSGRSLGTFFRDEVAGPLGLEFDIGLPEDLEPTVAPIIVWVPEPGYDSSFTRAIRTEPAGVSASAMKNMMKARTNPNSREYRAAELGGGGGVATARALAGMYAPLASGGGSLVGPDTLARMGEVSMATQDDAVLRIPTRFALGFMKSMDNRRRVPTSGCSAVLSAPAFGHVGAGGSLGFADPAAGMSFGYVMNRQGAGILLNDRGQSLVDAVYRSLGYRSDAAGVWLR